MKFFKFKLTLVCILVLFLIYLFLALNYDVKHIYNSISNEKIHSLNRLKKHIIQKEEYILDSLELDCEEMLSNSTNTTTETHFAKILKNTKFLANVELEIRNSTDRCAKIDEMFNFPKNPLSEEEAQYPLAYGILAYKDIVQVLFMLSSFYHPQNVYCIGVSENAGKPFIDLLRSLTNCFPNVYLMVRPNMKWGEHEIINTLFKVIEFLTHLKSDWKYFQYLSGFDVPLKTNLEMVRIFKALNKTPNIDIAPFEKNRLKGKKIADSPLPLYKSSMSALIPRHVANFLIFSPVPLNLLYFLQKTYISDESFFGTLFANKEKFDFPGAISGSKLLKLQESLTNKTSTVLANGHQLGYYISRHQVWAKAKIFKCHGYYKSSSCVFSIFDLPAMIQSKALVAHKFYIEKYPAAFFCALREVQTRYQNPEAHPINTTFYENLPQVQMTRGIALENVTTTDTLMF